MSFFLSFFLAFNYFNKPIFCSDVPKKAKTQFFFKKVRQTRPKKPEKRQKMPDDFINAKSPQIWLRKTPSGNAATETEREKERQIQIKARKAIE
jgi:hypothetical protein